MEELDGEVASAFNSWAKYIRGDTPNHRKYTDVRKRCITFASASKIIDRRLWTWEARGHAPVTQKDLFAVVMTVETFKEMLQRYNLRKYPAQIQIIVGGASPRGTHHFNERQVHRAFGLT